MCLGIHINMQVAALSSCKVSYEFVSDRINLYRTKVLMRVIHGIKTIGTGRPWTCF